MSELVTAVIPSFNYGRFLPRAIDSVLGQTYGNLECIVVDDGSTDDTQEVLARFAGRIQVIRQHNSGLSAARNSGIAASRGGCVGFLDADDAWRPRKIELQMRLLAERPQVGCVGCGHEHVHPDGSIERFPGKRNAADKHDTMRMIAVRRFWVGGSGSGALIRRDVLNSVGGFDQALSAAEDWDMWLKVSAATVIDNVPDILTVISRHGTGLFRNVQRMEQNQWAVYNKAVALWPTILGNTDRRRMRALILSDAAGECLHAQRPGDALGYYVKSLREWPFDYKRCAAAVKLGSRRGMRGIRAVLTTT